MIQYYSLHNSPFQKTVMKYGEQFEVMGEGENNLFNKSVMQLWQKCSLPKLTVTGEY